MTAKAGLFDTTSKSLGVTLIDYDLDPWPDVFVANDTQPNKLYRNNGNGTFTELGLQAGLAFSEDGRARAGMGADAADVDNSGATTVVVTNFSGEMLGLYRPVGDGQFADTAPRTDIGRATRLTLGFGCFFFDVDLDGLQDLLVVNGHIDETISSVAGRVSYAEPPHLFHNLGKGQFSDIAAEVGGGFAQPKVGRGAAFGDFDNDGDPDVVITTNNGPAFLYRVDAPAGSHSLRVKLRGMKSNRDGIGARVRVFAGSDKYLAAREDRVELSLAVRVARHVRPRCPRAGRSPRRRVAERHARRSESRRRGVCLRDHRRPRHHGLAPPSVAPQRARRNSPQRHREHENFWEVSRCHVSHAPYDLCAIYNSVANP